MLKYEGTDKIRDIKYEDGYVDRIYYDNNTLLVFTSDKEKTGADEVLFKGRKLIDVTSYGKCIQTNLPLGYTQIEYLESTGTLYIDTEVYPTNQTSIEAVMYVPSYETSEYGHWFWGTYETGKHFGVFSNQNNNKITFYRGNSNSTTTKELYQGEITFSNINDKSTLIITNNNNSSSITTTDNSFASQYTIYLFAVNIGGNSSTFNNKPGTRISQCKLYQGNSLVRDMIPVRIGTTGYMYDKVSGQLFGNAGTEDFVLGPDAVPTPDNPVDIVCNNGVLKYSANMANVNALTTLLGYYISALGVVIADANNWIYQDYIPVSPNTTYTLTMSLPVYFVSISEYSTADDSGFVIRKKGSTGTNTSLTITTDATTNFIRFGTNIDRTEVTLELVLAINWQLNKGDSMSYQPYVEGGLYTDGTVETINVHGKNLFDQSTNPVLQGNISSSTGGNVVSSTRCRTGNYISVKPSTAYTLTVDIDGYTGSNSAGIFVYEYNEDASSWAGSGWKNPTNGYKFTTLSTTAKIRIVFAKSSLKNIEPEDISNVQLEYGDTATKYQPYYLPQTASVENLFAVGNYNDIQSIINGIVTRNVGVKVLDGTENWTTLDQYGRVSIQNIPTMVDPSTPRSIEAFCNYFENLHSQESIDSVVSGQFYIAPPSGLYFHIELTSTALFKTWLATQYAAGTPVIVVYPLATPTTKQVLGQQLTIQQGNNTVEVTQASVDDIQLKVKYK